MSCWILLRGLTREAGHWGSFPELLQSRCPGDRVLAVDLPGNGSLHGERSPLRVEAMAEACRAALRERGVAPPYRVLAMSLGAMVTVAWAVAHPRDLDGCVLINTSLRPFSPVHHRLRPGNYARLLRLMLVGGDARHQEAAILAMTTHGVSDREAVLAHWMRLQKERPVSRANALRQLVAASRYTAPRRAPPVPMLLLASRQDGLVDVRCSQRLARAWQLPIALHPSAGHDLPLDDGPWVAGQAARWAQRLGSG